jgi:hypothetical protein
MAQQTEPVTNGHTLGAVEWLLKKHSDYGTLYYEDMTKAKAMEKEQRIKDYNAGYTDAQCNHINDAENYANEQEYVK